MNWKITCLHNTFSCKIGDVIGRQGNTEFYIKEIVSINPDLTTGLDEVDLILETRIVQHDS